MKCYEINSENAFYNIEINSEFLSWKINKLIKYI